MNRTQRHDDLIPWEPEMILVSPQGGAMYRKPIWTHEKERAAIAERAVRKMMREGRN